MDVSPLRRSDDDQMMIFADDADVSKDSVRAETLFASFASPGHPWRSGDTKTSRQIRGGF